MKRRRPEDAIQKAVCQFLDAALPRGVAMYWHTPNGGRRSKAEAGILKAMGTKAGVPDLCLMWSRHGHTRPFIGFIELKAPGGTLSEAQRQFAIASKALGAHWAMARSVEEVERHLRLWSVPLRGTVEAEAIAA